MRTATHRFENVKNYIEIFIPVMTAEEAEWLASGRTDFPEDTLLEWSGRLAEKDC